MQYILIDTEKSLKDLLSKLSCQKYVSIDTESNSLYEYQHKMCLMQISTPEINAVLDPLKVNVRILKKIMENKSIEKIFHSAEFDIKMIKKKCLCQINNIFDVMIAAKYLGIEKCGLDNLVKMYLGVDLDKKFQKANWGKRPLTLELLEYAVKDVYYLKSLRDIFHQELIRRNLTNEVFQEFAEISKIEPDENKFDENGFFRINGADKLNGKSLSVLREIFISREKRAKEMNLPPFKIISENLMLKISINPEYSLANLGRFKGITNYVLAKHGNWIRDAISKGLSLPDVVREKKEITPEKKEFLNGVKERFKLLKQWRTDVAQKRNLLPEVILSNAVLERIAFQNPKTIQELKSVKNLMEFKLKLYGEEIIKILKR